MMGQLNLCDKENIVHQLVKVQAQVKVKPMVKHGKPRINILNSEIKPRPDCCHDCHNDYIYDHEYECDCHSDCDFHCQSNDCNFTLTQVICVEIPISFGTDIDVGKGILCCGEPYIKPECKHGLENEINYNQIKILMSNKIRF